MSLKHEIANALRPVASRVGNMVKRAILERIDDSEGTQLVQVSLLEDEVQDRVEHMQPYGLSFVPPAGSEGLAVAVQGAGSHRVLLCASKRGARPTGAAEGEGGLHRLDGTWAVFVDEDGTLHLGKEDPEDFVALAGKVLDELNAVRSDITSLSNAVANHSHAVATTGDATAQTGSTTSTIFTPPTPHTPQSVASEILKAE